MAVAARFLGLVALWSTVACQGQRVVQAPAATGSTGRVANLHALGRLYGVLRWFHPSDAAAVIDWDRFAVDGARRVIDAADPRALRAALDDLIAPIAPTVHLAGPGEQFPVDPALHPASTAGLEVVSWEHEGFGDTIYTSVYASKRRHRERSVPAAGVPFAALWQAVDATPYRGAAIRLTGRLRTAKGARGQLWLRVDRGDATGFFDNMDDHPVISADWSRAEIAGKVDGDATRIAFGTLMDGPGTAWYDDLELSVQRADGSWQPIEIKDAGFESEQLLASWTPGIGKRSISTLDGWNASLDPDRPASGSASLRVERVATVMSDELFPEEPRPGETVDVDLGSGLRARVPIALYSKDGRTIGDDPEAARRAQAGPAVVRAAGFDTAAGAADVIVLWSALEHFWPYWDIVSVDWGAELDAALRDALDDRNVEDHAATLRRLTAAAPDAHAGTTCVGEGPLAYPQFAVELVEGQVVVTASGDDAVARGDVIVSAGGRGAVAQLVEAESLVSGSQQWKLFRASRDFGAGPRGSTLPLRIHRAGADLDARVARGDRFPRQHMHASIERFDDGVYYVDLDRASMAAIDAEMDRLAAAPAVIFDLRGYPNANHNVLSHLLTRPDDSKAWMAIPHVIRPDHVAGSIAAWDNHGWEMPVLQPHIAGRVAFLTGPGAVSYAESVMGLVEHYHLGEIVGSATAGTNGNIVQVAEPTGCRTTFTGMRVTKHDHTQHHLIGVQPTIPAARTIAGVIAGRDEVLERALAYVRTGK